MKIGLTLSGGAVHGMAHLGALKALEELNIPLHVISGVSSGALAGAFYAAGYTPEEIFRIVADVKMWRLMKPAFSKVGLFQMNLVEKEIGKYLGDRTFEDLKLPLIICTTDLRQGTNVYFSSGNLIKPLVGTLTVPILCSPLVYQNYLLVDGGLINNLPIDCLVDQADFRIGVHVNPMNHHAQLTSFRSILERTLHLAINTNVQQRMPLCDFLIEPPALKNYSLVNIRKAREMFEAGYDHTISLADKLLGLLKKAN
jgi:NTE family protein